MVADWPQHSLGDLCSLITDGKHGDCRDEQGSGYYFLSVKDVLDGRMVYDDAREIAQADFEETHRRTNLTPGDILFTNTGTIGRMAIVPDDPRTPRTTFQKSVAILKPKRDVIHPRFLYYLLRFDNVRLSDFAAGTTQKNLLLKDFRSFEVRVPPLPEQKAIAAMLGALDDKIELNRRMNATLEAMARALFQSWFVDFDPVRAKLDGRQPTGLDPAGVALFPNEFEDSDLGPIPKGWTIEPVGDVVVCVGGSTPSTTEPKFWDGGVHCFATPKDLSQLDASVLLTTERQITQAGVTRISSGLLPAGTLLLSSRAPVGYLAIAAIPVAVNQGFIAMKCNERASNYFMLNWCRSNMIEIESRASGTTFAEISKQNFRPISLLLPPEALMRKFTTFVEPIYKQIAVNVRTSHTLAAIREALLPRLLTGKLRVDTRS
jgi:type I restriction enzyme, S subunit